MGRVVHLFQQVSKELKLSILVSVLIVYLRRSILIIGNGTKPNYSQFNGYLTFG